MPNPNGVTNTPIFEIILALPLKECVRCGILFKRRNACHKICDICKKPRRCQCSKNCSGLVSTWGKKYAQGHAPTCGNTGHHQTRKQKLAASRANKGKPKSERHKLKQSRIMKAHFANGMVNAFKGKQHSVKTRKLISEHRKGKLTGLDNPGRGEMYRGVNGERKMCSKDEVCFAKWLDKKNILWEFAPERFKTPFGLYTPDFFVHDWCKFIELKYAGGKRRLDNIRVKKALWFGKNSGFKFRMLDHNDLVKIGVV